MRTLSKAEFDPVIDCNVAYVDYFQEYYINRDKHLTVTALFHRNHTHPVREDEENAETLMFTFKYVYDEQHKAEWKLDSASMKGNFSKLERSVLFKVALDEMRHIFVLFTESVIDNTYERSDEYGIRAFGSDLEEIALR